jgi:hypothetical protein
MTDSPTVTNPDVPKPMSFEEMKGKLIANFSNLYNAFCAQLATIPCAHQLQAHAMRHFDDGFLSFREGIATLQMPAPQAPVEAVAAQEARVETETKPELEHTPPAA